LFQRILVPVDASPLSDHALDIAFRLAIQFGSSVHVIFARPNPAAQDPTTVADDLAEVDRQNKWLLTSVTRVRQGHALDSRRITTEVRAGPATQVIVAAAEEMECDLIVMGTHGRHGIVDAVLGSTTEQVVARSKSSVLVVRSESYDAEDGEAD
jgi:nucleotide-binding universal stress UspA family protein